MTRRFVYSNCNGAKSSFARIRAFLSTLTICSAIFLGECLSEVVLCPFFTETDAILDNGRGISAHYGKDGPTNTIKSEKFDIITTEWSTTKEKHGKMIPVILTSVYRNQHTDDLTEFLDEIIQQIQEMKTSWSNDTMVVIWGDFNASSGSCIKLVNEIEGLYHADSPDHFHLPNSQPTQIDHIFMTDQIQMTINYHDPLESKPEALTVTGDKLGHKTMELFIPDLDNFSITQDTILFNKSSFNKFLKNRLPILRNIWADGKPDLETKTRKFMEIIQKGVLKCTTTKTLTQNFNENRDFFITNQLLNSETSNCKSPTKTFFTCAKKIMKCGFYESATTRREDNDFAEFLQEKIHSVPKPPHNPESDIIIDESFRLDNDLKMEKSEIKKFMTSFKSGARDRFSISGKIMSQMAESKEMVELFTIMINEIFKTGFIPKCIRNDFIFGLYKGKGQITEPKNFRPISISCWSLKLVEKCLVKFLSKHDYLNFMDFGMHAYRAGVNCSTALLNLDKLLQRLNSKINEKLIFNSTNCKVSIFIDYRGAFEGVSTNAIIKSISHPILQKLAQQCFIRTVSIGSKILTYLKWKSIPQGSCFSPLAYNRADSQVINYAKKLWKEAGIEAEIVGFSDDHVLVTTVGQAKKAVELMVQAIDRFGFAFEPKKTEILMSAESININPNFKLKLTDISTSTTHTFKPKSKLKWLGFIIKMNNDGLEVIFQGQLRNVINTFKAAVATCTSENKRAVYNIYVSPIIRMFTVFEDTTVFEDKITQFIRPQQPLKPALDTMKNFILKSLGMDKNSTKEQIEQRIYDCREDDWKSLEIRMLQRLVNSA